MLDDVQEAFLGFFTTESIAENASLPQHLKVTSGRYAGKCWVYPAVKTPYESGAVSCDSELNASIALHFWYVMCLSCLFSLISRQNKF